MDVAIPFGVPRGVSFIIFWVLYTSLAWADRFTNPPYESRDLQEHYVIGQKIQVTWVAAGLRKFTLEVRQWTQKRDGDVIGILAREYLPLIKAHDDGRRKSFDLLAFRRRTEPTDAPVGHRRG